MTALSLAQNGAAVQVVGADPILEGVGFKNAAGLMEPVATADGRAGRWTGDSIEFCDWAAADPAWGLVPRRVLFLSDDPDATNQDWIVSMGRREASPEDLQGRRAHGAWFETYVLQPDRAVAAFKRESRNLNVVGLTQEAAIGSATLESIEAVADRAIGQKSHVFVVAAGLGLAKFTDIEDLAGMEPAAGMSAGMGLTIRIPADRFNPGLDHVLMDDDDLGYLIPQITHVVAGGTNDIAEHDDPVVEVGAHPALLAEWEAEVRDKIERLLPRAGNLSGEIRLGARPMRRRVLTHRTEEFPIPGILLGGAGGSGWTFSVGMAHDACRVIAERFGRSGDLLALGTRRPLDFPGDDVGAAA
jgi:glycine/D-amino acid oxidase-like deaminating enzyme